MFTNATDILFFLSLIEAGQAYSGLPKFRVIEESWKILRSIFFSFSFLKMEFQDLCQVPHFFRVIKYFYHDRHLKIGYIDDFEGREHTIFAYFGLY